MYQRKGYFSKPRGLAFVTFLIFFMNCAKEESPIVNPEIEQIVPPDEEEVIEPSQTVVENCEVSQIDFLQSQSVQYRRNEDGLYQITEIRSSDTNFYVNHIANDSIIIGYIPPGSSDDFPQIRAKYNDAGQVVSLQRIYYSGGINLYSFEYESDKIRVTQESILGGNWNGRVVNSYGDYFLDDNKNVVSVKKYRYDRYDETNIYNDPTTFSIYRDQTFEYDTYNNPWKDITYPAFLNSILPCSRFFSTNNIIRITSGELSTPIRYEYTNNLTTKRMRLITPQGLVCDSTDEETYSYGDCGD